MQTTFTKHPTKGETKNCIRYLEDDTVNPIIGSLYVRKDALKKEYGEFPERVNITITIGGELLAAKS